MSESPVVNNFKLQPSVVNPFSLFMPQLKSYTTYMFRSMFELSINDKEAVNFIVALIGTFLFLVTVISMLLTSMKRYTMFYTCSKKWVFALKWDEGNE